VDIALAYTTRFFRREPQHLDGDIAAIIPPTPGGKRGGVMLAQEGGRWTVTLISHFGPAAPRELEEFREFARSLPAPLIYETIRTAEPVGEPATARLPSSIRRRYENLARFPEGYLVLGDAICSFNPIYGQGMSVAALEAQVLNNSLVARDDAHLARRFFRKTAAVVDIPWSIAVGNDLRMPETQGPRGGGVPFINWYMSRLHRAAHRDAELAVAFHRVANLLAPPQTLFRPAMIFRVLISLCATAVLSRCAVQRSSEAQTVRQSRRIGSVSVRDRSVTGAGHEWANSAE
jgi:2-polyprenyl-6-methoxyphenol hydroxylase-like FAD-dependent oxidoreductase